MNGELLSVNCDGKARGAQAFSRLRRGHLPKAASLARAPSRAAAEGREATAAPERMITRGSQAESCQVTKTRRSAVGDL
ncbi:MAG: hypothetical protein NT154_47155 [Verrucomicrobia bacterium]|nr:hypothetical protein [Verrucomicrobiota bacterium]